MSSEPVSPKRALKIVSGIISIGRELDANPTQLTGSIQARVPGADANGCSEFAREDEGAEEAEQAGPHLSTYIAIIIRYRNLQLPGAYGLILPMLEI